VAKKSKEELPDTRIYLSTKQLRSPEGTKEAQPFNRYPLYILGIAYIPEMT
jgi:hypothetical protein